MHTYYSLYVEVRGKSLSQSTHVTRLLYSKCFYLPHLIPQACFFFFFFFQVCRLHVCRSEVFVEFSRAELEMIMSHHIRAGHSDLGPL